MNKTKSMWSSIRKVILVVNFTNLDELTKLRESIKKVGLNIHECVILCNVSDRKEKNILREKNSVVFLNEKEINFFGRVKNVEAIKLFTRKFDLMLIFEDLPKKIEKQMTKLNAKMKVGVNTQNANLAIRLNSNSKSQMHLLEFVKKTLEKIN